MHVALGTLDRSSGLFALYHSGNTTRVLPIHAPFSEYVLPGVGGGAGLEAGGGGGVVIFGLLGVSCDKAGRGIEAMHSQGHARLLQVDAVCAHCDDMPNTGLSALLHICGVLDVDGQPKPYASTSQLPRWNLTAVLRRHPTALSLFCAYVCAIYIYVCPMGYHYHPPKKFQISSYPETQ